MIDDNGDAAGSGDGDAPGTVVGDAGDGVTEVDDAGTGAVWLETAGEICAQRSRAPGAHITTTLIPAIKTLDKRTPPQPPGSCSLRALG